MSVFVTSQCRLCLDYDSPKVNALNKVPNEADIPSVIYELFSFWIKQSDVITKDICLDCVKMVKFFYLFTLKVRESQRVLISNVTKEVKVEFDDDNKDGCISLASYNNVNLDYIESKIIQETSDIIQNKFAEQTNIEVINKYETVEKLQYNNDGVLNNEQNHNTDSNDSIFEDISDQKPLTSDVEKDIPKELYKDGEFTVSKDVLDNLVNNFYNIECTICEDKPQFLKYCELFEHCKMEHNRKGFLVCCKRKMIERRRFVSHMVCHMQPDAFKCKICNTVTTSPSYLSYHMKHFHLPDSEKNFPCDQCEKRFVNASALNEHKQVVHVSRNEESKLTCMECGKTYYSQLTLNRHMYTHREQASRPSFLCPTCGKSFPSNSNFQQHLTMHNPAARAPVQCQECGVSMKTKAILRVHMKVQHSPTVLSCKLCDYAHRSSTALKCHMISKHSNDKPFVCEVCNKGFKFKVHLQNHSVQHTGEHRYVCSFCPRTFAHSGNRYTHQIRMHPELYKSTRSKTHQSKAVYSAVKSKEDLR